jgi:hypothetical protein
VKEGRSMRKTFAVAGCAAAVALLAASAAYADQPAFTHNEPITFDQFDTTSCAFPFREIGDGFVSRTVFVDENGNPTRILTHFNLDGVAVNEANGKTAQLQENLIVNRDLETGERTWSGMRIKATMPGGGALLIDVGRVIFDSTGEVIFEAGQHQLIHEDFADFCAAMG